MLILALYIDSVIQDIKIFLKTQIGLIEDDILLVLDEYSSSFITYEIEPGIYISKDTSKAILNILHPECKLYNNSIDTEYDDITMETKFAARLGIISVRFDEFSFFSTILGFTSRWD